MVWASPGGAFEFLGYRVICCVLFDARILGGGGFRSRGEGGEGMCVVAGRRALEKEGDQSRALCFLWGFFSPLM